MSDDKFAARLFLGMIGGLVILLVAAFVFVALPQMHREQACHDAGGVFVNSRGGTDVCLDRNSIMGVEIDG